MADHHPEIIIIKRHSAHEDGHHGGAWKIAFADFMTAMMAFFLVLWIINATDKDTKTVIARYFNPVKLENPARATKGVHGVDSMTQSQTDQASGKDEPGAPVEPKHPAAQDGKAGGAANGDAASKKEEKPKKATPPPPPPAPPSQAAKDPAEPAAAKPTMSESELFSDPVKSLDKIEAGKNAPSRGADSEGSAGDSSRQPSVTPIDSFRDPFKPTGPGPTDDRLALDADAPTAATEDNDLQKGGGGKPAGGDKAPSAESGPAEEAAKPGAADAAHQASAPAKLASAAAELFKELQDKLGALGKSSASPAIDVKVTDEGLLVSLTDKMNYSMFAVGSPEPNPAVIQAMNSIAKVLKDRPGAIVLRGHTDGRAYKAGGYDNWRLSSARAQMAYYMLTRAGIPASRFDRVEGHADRALRDGAHPLAAENRRIEILLRAPKT
jgi:chemotaxis protein MotB